jgi:hypothetical protein
MGNDLLYTEKEREKTVRGPGQGHMERGGHAQP